MLALLEVPPVYSAIAPNLIVAAIDSAKAWVGRRGRGSVIASLTVLGTLLMIKRLDRVAELTAV